MSARSRLAALSPPTSPPPDAQEPAAEPEVRVAPWPDPLADAAWHGLAGEIVHALEPHTEADPAALLLQLLVAVGNVAGRGPHTTAEADRHGGNLFVALVGTTAKGRKGTSWGRVREIFKEVDPDWASTRVWSGLSSGEGLIYQVRDAQHDQQPIKERGRVTGYETVETDPGVADKRLLVVEGELASALRVLARDGNTLSALIRNAWDSGDLRTMTKSPLLATGAHISIIGHITRDELLRYLGDTEAANGFANRFLWGAVRRARELPDGGGMVDVAPFVRGLRRVMEHTQAVGHLQRDQGAAEVWHHIYGRLSEGRPGLLGAVTARAEAQVLRLACIYAALDLEAVVRREHLEAALAVWDYCEASARFIFGDAMGDPIADAILAALRKAPAGLTRTEISGLFSGHQHAKVIARALGTLIERGLARSHRASAEPGGGRSPETWYADGAAKLAKMAK